MKRVHNPKVVVSRPLRVQRVSAGLSRVPSLHWSHPGPMDGQGWCKSDRIENEIDSLPEFVYPVAAVAVV